MPKDLDKFGHSPAVYPEIHAGLDLKCNHGSRIPAGFNQLLYFVNVYLAENGQGNYENEHVELIFNRDIQINETETINNIQNSKGIISDKTLVANHPWINDVEQELEQIEKERKSDEPPMFADKESDE